MSNIETVVHVVEDEKTTESARADLKKRKTPEETLSILKSAFTDSANGENSNED